MGRERGGFVPQRSKSFSIGGVTGMYLCHAAARIPKYPTDLSALQLLLDGSGLQGGLFESGAITTSIVEDERHSENNMGNT